MWDSIATDSCKPCQCPPRSNRTEDAFMDKENFSPMKSDELSFYGSNSPPTAMCTGTSPNHCLHNSKSRRPLEDYDPNSRDSGYIGNYASENGKLSPTSRGFSFESGSGSMESDFYEALYEIEPIEENLPQDFDKLLKGQMFQNRPKLPPRSVSPRDCRPSLCRALSLQNEKTTPNSSRVRSCLFKPIAGDLRAFKRPDPPMEQDSPVNSKKARFGDDDDDEAMMGVEQVPSRPVLQRPFSATEESIKWAVNKSETEPDLIGDFSKNYSLPLTPGRHKDLKAITPHTLAHLLQGKFESNIGSFKVIDCRYPYEYEGGHINGAVNIYTKDQCIELLNHFRTPVDPIDKRHNILVFHCEFSSERAPKLYRYLRELDRQLNQEAYPSLHYPEIYLLEGGYKSFFEQFKKLCVPVAYKEMLHPDHGKDLRLFRQMAKSCNLDSRENRKKRLGL